MRIGLIGYGKMGRGIFSLLSDPPLDTTVLVRDPTKAEDNNRRLEKRLRRSAGSTFPAEELERRLSGLKFTSRWEDLAGCDLVIETISEDHAVKTDVLRRVEELVSPEALIATNSSSFSPTDLAKALRKPDRFCGFHFFHPVQLTSIVEIIVAEKTDPAAVERLREVARTLRLKPLTIHDLAGSGINVVLTGMTCEALYILEQGLALPSVLDGYTARMARVGPCESLDVTGVSFFTEVLERTVNAFPFHYGVPELCRKLARDGRDGKYAGGGVYLYRDDRPVDDAPEYYLNPQQTHSPRQSPSDPESLISRLLFQIYYGTLYLTKLGVGQLDELCLGIQDLIGLKEDPLAKMRALGPAGLKMEFDRLREQFGPRYDCTPFEDTLELLEE